MGKAWVVLVSGWIGLAALAASAHEMGHEMGHGGMMHGMDGGPMAEDGRASLHLAAPMRMMQKRMMREHLAAVQAIVGLVADGRFDEAAKIAHEKLGLTPAMKKMCDMFGNNDFRTMGLAFHSQADELGEVLKTRNLNKSLRALHSVLNSCVQCHARFRQ